jgi:hypothetical protein
VGLDEKWVHPIYFQIISTNPKNTLKPKKSERISWQLEMGIVKKDVPHEWMGRAKAGFRVIFIDKTRDERGDVVTVKQDVTFISINQERKVFRHFAFTDTSYVHPLFL